MNSEQEKQLKDYLASLGFEGDKFNANLQEKLKLNAPSFSVTHKVPFGEEQMLFRLYFNKDPQFDAYRLQKYNASHRSPVVIDHKYINGIDTAELEAKMKGYDWDLYFDPRSEIIHPKAMKEMREITAQLNKLAEGQTFDGIQIQEALLYKYWPADNYNSNNKRDFKIHYERDRDFSATEYGTCNTNLAYHIVSGRLDDLHEKLQVLELDAWPGADLYQKLEKVLDANPQDFKLEFSRNEPEAFTDITIPVVTIADEFTVDTYTMAVTPHPVIEHGVYNGIDSKQLEDMMREIDWHNDRQLFIYREDEEPGFQPRVAVVQEHIYRLSQDLTGADIADKLMAKYWSDATFFEGMLQQTAWDYLNGLPKLTQEFPAELNAKAAYNLLCGRAIPEHLMYPFRPESDHWVRLDLQNKDGNGNYNVVPVTGISMIDLENTLDVIPIPNTHYYPVKNGLLRGDLVAVTLSKERKVLLEVNPEGKTVSVYTPDKRLIPTNFNLDPDWEPHQTQSQQAAEKERIKPSVTPKNIPKKRKGRGI